MYLRRIGSRVLVHTPAKLNLFLEVLSRRADGFHEIETLITAIGVFDTLTFTPSDDGDLSLECHWAYGWRAWQRAAFGGEAMGEVPVTPENLVLRAVERLRQRAGVELGGTLQLVKRIASAAGLGGASSDAAAALLAANDAWELGWSRAQLESVAAEIGSDVPFFLATGQFGPGAALCRGRGEQIEPISVLGPLHFVVVRPPEGLGTAAVYRQCRPAEQPADVAPLVSALRAGRLADVGRRMVNRLQEPAARLSGWIGRLQHLFEQNDCVGHQMSGSGSSYFGLCRHQHQARRLAARLRAASVGAVYAASTLTSTSPHLLHLSALDGEPT